VNGNQTNVAGATGGKNRPRVLVLASTFPSSVYPLHGVFVKERMKAVAARGEFDLRVVSPTPWFPPVKMFPRWYPLSQISDRENVEGLEVTRPRYPLIPKIGGYFHAHVMYWSIRRTIARLRRDFPFDLIDSHFVYPDGVVAAMLGDLYKVPVVMTARGEDMIRFPDLPMIGQAIRWGLPRATQMVALSEELAQKMRPPVAQLRGKPAELVARIGQRNGFSPRRKGRAGKPLCGMGLDSRVQSQIGGKAVIPRHQHRRGRGVRGQPQETARQIPHPAVVKPDHHRRPHQPLCQICPARHAMQGRGTR